MRIVSAEVYCMCPEPRAAGEGWHPTFLRLHTDEGINGLGEIGFAYGTGAQGGIGMLRDMLAAHVLGADPMRIETMWDRLFRRTFWGQGGGPVVYGAMSAIDMALWDIKGQALEAPVYELLGGCTNDTIRVYANGWYSVRGPEGRRSCNRPEEYAEAAQQVVADGYDALKFDPFAVTPDGRWLYTRRLLSRELADLAFGRVKAVREAVGPEVDILIEVHGNLGVRSAIEMGCRFVELDPFFYEEPVDALNVDAMNKVSENVPLPIAAGERLYTRYGFRQYIEKQALDILQPDMGLAGGISEVKKIATYAEVYNLHVQPHNCGGPISTAAAMQLDACISNFCIQELFPYHTDGTHELVTEPIEKQIVGSRYQIGEKPGLGVELDEERCKPFLAYRVE